MKMDPQKQLKLLKKIIGTTDMDGALPFNVSALEKIIKEKIPKTLAKNAPANFPELYFEFEYVYSKFYDFLLFNRLIGKKIVALGGGFSSGKSTFLNTLLGNAKILPTALNPSTSVPTYVLAGSDEQASAINAFSAKIDIDLADVRAIAHGFGEDEHNNELTLGHLLRSVFVATPQFEYSNIAFLDTPGYSKADSENYSAKTDEKIAHSQLNSSDYIIWFIGADAGTISIDDINFLSTLDRSIPKLIIINKADKVASKNDLFEMQRNIKSALDLKGIKYEGVLSYSRRDDVECDRAEVKKFLAQLDKGKTDVDFAYSFKKLFVACKNYYDDSLNEAKRRLSRFNHALTLGGENSEINDCLNDLAADTKHEIQELNDLRQRLHDLQSEFFTEIKFIANQVNIKMPEPTEIDLLEDKISDPPTVVRRLLEKNNIEPDREFLRQMQKKLREIDPELNKAPGGTKYRTELFNLMKEGLQ